VLAAPRAEDDRREQHDHAEREVNSWIDPAVSRADLAGTLEREPIARRSAALVIGPPSRYASINRCGFRNSLITAEARREPD
jgi:hypothetical protein